MGQKLLIIDDDEDFVMITETILSKIRPEITIEVASSGEEGLALLRNETVLPALILLDVKMPGMSGIDVLRKIRDEKRLNTIPVVVVTHSIIKDDLVASFKLGANSILLKSGNTDEFRKSIRNLIERFIEK